MEYFEFAPHQHYHHVSAAGPPPNHLLDDDAGVAVAHLHPYPPSSPLAAPPSAPSSKIGTYPPNAALPNNHIPCDIKPRLTKEQHDVLDCHYQSQTKPNTAAKRMVAQRLGVTLEKVHNWFQNRRAKSKQDAKRQIEAASEAASEAEAEAATASTDSLAPSLPQSTAASESDGSAFTAPEYLTSAQSWLANDHFDDTIAALTAAPPADDLSMGNFAFHSAADYVPRHPPACALPRPSQLPYGMFDNDAQAFNRRTLTQEQFDAYAHDGGMVNGSGDFEDFSMGFSGDTHVLGQVFPNAHVAYKHPGDITFPYALGAPQTSYDSSVPSNFSEPSFPHFPSPAPMDGPRSASTTTLDYVDSRNTSMSFPPDEPQFPQMPASEPSQPPVQQSTQWQPGQSVPVDIRSMSEQFRQAKQAAQARPSSQRMLSFEQSLGWNAEDAAVRRGSQTSLLANSLSNVGLHTPAPPQSPTFKSPAPPSNIAARRQRARPAPLGLAALRSQSYSDGLGPSSAGPALQPAPISAMPGMRRIRSSNVLTGMAPGRINKSTLGLAQRSPLHANFAEAIHSPKFARHFSQPHEGSTPPTPLSPIDHGLAEEHEQLPFWSADPRQAVYGTGMDGHVSFSHDAFAAGPTAFRASPPHTPLPAQPLQLAHPLHGSLVIPENTPPQSAPASQQSFPSTIFATRPPPPPTESAPVAPPVVAKAKPAPAPQQYMHVLFTEPTEPAGPQPTIPATTRVPTGPIQFANGVPIINADGSVQMAFPSQTQFVPKQYPQPPPAPPAPAQQRPSPAVDVQQQQTPSIPAGPQPTTTNFQFVTPAGKPQTPDPNFLPAPASVSPQPPPELFVHEYKQPPGHHHPVPPPRRTGSSSDLPLQPKNYTFANHTMEHFDGRKGKKSASSTAGSSSSSAAGDVRTSATASTSPSSSLGGVALPLYGVGD